MTAGALLPAALAPQKPLPEATVECSVRDKVLQRAVLVAREEQLC